MPARQRADGEATARAELIRQVTRRHLIAAQYVDLFLRALGGS
jgi:hypothetical protein